MEFNHLPVLLQECLQNLNIKNNGIYLDGTVGGAGHSVEIYNKLDKNGILIALDQDEYAIRVSSQRLKEVEGQARIILENTNFKNIKDVCLKNNIEVLDGVLLDLGVSSYQLDTKDRGFSYNYDALLDMRMDTINNHLSAIEVINEFSEDQIREIIWKYGEERWASRIAKFIVARRIEKRIETTFELVEIIKNAIPSSARREGPHPAKRTFQAIRIAVNNELGILEKTIEEIINLLRIGGRFCIITFHSLEDRIVKNSFLNFSKPCTCPPNFPMCICGKKPLIKIISRKAITPSQLELENNSRSRSAKLRVIEKI